MRNVIALWHYTELPELNGGSELSAGPRPQARSSRAWACLPHTWTDNDRPHTEAAPLFLVARVPGRCSGTRPAREAAVPRTGGSPVRPVPVVALPDPDFRTCVPGPYAESPCTERADGPVYTIGGAMLKDKNSSRSEAQPQGARRASAAEGAGAEPPVERHTAGRRERTARVLRLGSTTHLDHTKPPRDCRARPLSGSSSRSRTRNPKARAW